MIFDPRLQFFKFLYENMNVILNTIALAQKVKNAQAGFSAKNHRSSILHIPIKIKSLITS